VSGFPLDPKPDDMRAMGEAALDHVVSFLEGLETAPADNSERGVAVAERLRAAPPELGGSFDDALEEFRQASAHTFEFAGPGYLAYIPGGGLFASAIADLLTLGTNRFVNLWVPAPGVVQIEQNVVRWLCDLFGYPDEARGILTSGGSLANFSAVVTARHTRLGEDFLDGVYYVSAQSHASVTKAAALAGFSRRNARIIPTDAELRMDPEALRQQVRADRAAGLRPFLVVPAAGTTNTGAIDPLDAIADIADQEELWMHVDAAYGGFFVLTDRGRERFRGVERADSVTLDPHKGMFLPYGTGSLVVRDGAALRAAHYEGAAYLQDLIAEGDLPNFSEYSPELSRDVRGLRVWLPLKLHGVAAFREALDE
jgi:aromatic-L-amino-acid decarboxylase